MNPALSTSRAGKDEIYPVSSAADPSHAFQASGTVRIKIKRSFSQKSTSSAPRLPTTVTRASEIAGESSRASRGEALPLIVAMCLVLVRISGSRSQASFHSIIRVTAPRTTRLMVVGSVVNDTNGATTSAKSSIVVVQGFGTYPLADMLSSNSVNDQLQRLS